tara:strand:+ start:1726 stop:2109 length:384 start_codon:yes stop_codon:yes gene_type:complete
MAKAKQGTKKTTVKKTEVKVEETPVKEAQTYLSSLFLIQEPAAKDLQVGQISYHKQSGSFAFSCSNPKYQSELGNIIQSDLSYNEDGKMSVVSKSQSPISWIINLHKSNELAFYNFRAGEAREVYEA